MAFFPDSPDLHAHAAATAGYSFQAVGIGIAIYSNRGIDPICTPVNVSAFELQHGREQDRWLHNSRCMEQVKAEGRAVLAEHAGFWDLFVPVGKGPTLRAILMTGPFLRERPGGAEVRQHWLWLSGQSPLATDAAFASYVETTFATPVLDARCLATFQRSLVGFARLLESNSDPAAAGEEVRELSNQLAASTRLGKMWEIAASMLDARTARSWSSRQRQAELHAIGVGYAPDQLLVGLSTSTRAAEADPVDQLVRRHAFVPACLDLTRRSKELICGRLSDRGVVLLVRGSGSAMQRREQLLELAHAARSLAARRFGLELHVGVGPVRPTESLHLQFAQALGAAETALAKGRSIVHAEAGVAAGGGVLGGLRRELSSVAATQPDLLAAGFERYAQTVAVHCGYVLEPIRAHLEAGFERVYDALAPAGPLEARGVSELLVALDTDASDAPTVTSLIAAFRRAVSQLVEARIQPSSARRDRNLGRALAYIHEHCADPDLSLQRVAKVAGFAPSHFSELFKREHDVAFVRYVQALRIERAKQMLMASDLAIESVARLSGFPERHYFHRAFRNLVGMTPLRYRNRIRPH